MDFWISDWISGFQIGFLDFTVDFWISAWISGFQFGFLQTVYEISFVTDPSQAYMQKFGKLNFVKTGLKCKFGVNPQFFLMRYVCT